MCSEKSLFCTFRLQNVCDDKNVAIKCVQLSESYPPWNASMRSLNPKEHGGYIFAGHLSSGMSLILELAGYKLVQTLLYHRILKSYGMHQ